MKREVLSSKPHKRRQQIGCLVGLLVILPIIAAAFYWKVDSVERDVATLCHETQIGSRFDSSLFSKKATAAGFQTHVREGSPDNTLTCWKKAIYRSRICRIYYRDGVVTGIELMWSPN
jgi:hypothetical protein